MRFACVTLFAAMLSPGGALASSIVTLPAEKVSISPSIIFLGEPAIVAAVAPPEAPAEVALNYPVPETLYGGAARAAPAIVSPSIIALGEPAVENFQVAAIKDDKPARRPALAPMVIRGGISGEAFTPSAAPARQEAAPQQEASAPAPRKGPPKRQPAPEPEKAPAAPPPPSPRGSGGLKGSQR